MNQLTEPFYYFSSAKDKVNEEKRELKVVPKDPEIIMPANEVPEKDASSMIECPEFSPTNAE